MSRKSLLPLTLGLLAAGWLMIVSTVLARPASASPGAAPAAQYTYIPTPTPGPDGRIIYIVQAGDSAWAIAARFGFTGDKYNELKSLNKWGDNPILNVGDQVILGYAGPTGPNATAGPTATLQPALPSPSPLPGKAELCVLLYNDINGDSIRQEEEPAVPGGQISVTNRIGSVSKTEPTASGYKPVCFEELPEGLYNISVAKPDGYNETTNKDMVITLKGGDITTMDFGIQADSKTEVAVQAPTEPSKSPMLMIAGILILAVGGALALFGGRLMSLRSKAIPK
jgi:hypothetical protein